MLFKRRDFSQFLADRSPAPGPQKQRHRRSALAARLLRQLESLKGTAVTGRLRSLAR